jgi:capsular polysaccharide transport system permease protein
MDSTPPNFDQLTAISRPEKSFWSRFRHSAAYIYRRHRGLFLFVLLPTFISATYLFGWAADQYQSEAQFVIYSAQGGQTGLGGLGQVLGLGDGGGSTTSETFSVIAYMESLDAIKALDRTLNLTKIFRAPQADFLSRLWYANPPAEKLLKYYDRKVVVTYQEQTTITTLDVHAFAAQDAYNIANMLLSLGEQRVNAYNDRITADTVKVANDEVALAETRIEQSEIAMTKFRQQHGDLNPELSGTADMSLIATLSGQLAQSEAQLAQMQGLRSDSPQMEAVRNRISAIHQQIASQNASLTGNSGALAPVLAQYQDLALHLQFAQQSYTAAQTALTAANEEALKQKLFLVRVVEPNMPQVALFPRRFWIVGTIFVTLLIAYGIIWLLAAGVREHAI